MKKIFLIAGARPNFMKPVLSTAEGIAPIVFAGTILPGAKWRASREAASIGEETSTPMRRERIGSPDMTTRRNAKRSKGESQDETSTTVIVGKGPVKAKVKAQAVLGALIETRSATTACWPPYPKMTAIASSNRQGWLTVQHDIY